MGGIGSALFCEAGLWREASGKIWVGGGEVVGRAENEGSEGWGTRRWMAERNEASGGGGRTITIS